MQRMDIAKAAVSFNTGTSGEDICFWLQPASPFPNGLTNSALRQTIHRNSVQNILMTTEKSTMNIPTLNISSELAELWPETRLGCLVYEAQVKPDCAEVWEQTNLLLPALRTTLEKTPLADMPNLGEARAAYKAFGKDPGRFRISSEALYRRIRQNKDLYHINSVVDTNNLVSLETGFSLGSYDLDMIGPNVIFRLGTEGEVYAGIGKSDINLHRMPLLADEHGAFGSPTSDSTRGMITDRTRHVLTVIYSFSSSEKFNQALLCAQNRFSTLIAPSHFSMFTVDGTA